VERAVAGAAGIDDGAAQALQAGIDRSRPDRGLAGFKLRPGGRPPAERRGGWRRDDGLRRRGQRRTRLGSELASEQLSA
jgi:hypothetical protein